MNGSDSIRDYLNARRLSGRIYVFLAGLLLFAMFANSVFAELAVKDEMDHVARNWLSYIIANTGSWGGSTDPQIVAVDEVYVNDTLLGRCYQTSPEGFILVPALKELPPIKAYSDKNKLEFDATQGMGAMLKEIVKGRHDLFIGEFGSLEAIQPLDKPLFDNSNKEKWGLYAVDPSEFSVAQVKGTEQFESVGPLLTSTWHQSSPYNNLCPPGDGGRCLVGCVATAAAQIQNYHQWPPAGEGSHTYNWGGDNSCGGSSPAMQLTADYSDPYVYDTDPDNLAEISYEMGVAFNMFYGVCGSGAYTMDGADVFPQYYRYDPSAIDVYRTAYSQFTWFNLVKENINMNRPTLYRIYSHAIVCDGWRVSGTSNEYHFNYGWGGSNNAWYVVDNLYCPWAGCDPMVEAMVVNIIPLTGNPWLGSVLFDDAVGGDGDSIPEGGETVDYYVTIANYGGDLMTDVTMSLAIDDASINIINGSSYLGTILSNDSVMNLSDPFSFEIPLEYVPRLDSFFLTITWNGGTKMDTLVLEQSIGKPSIILVDDDENDDLEKYYTKCLSNRRLPYDIYGQTSTVAPDSMLLRDYDIVIWFCGDDHFGQLNMNETAAIRGFLNGGGKLFLSGQRIAWQLNTYEPSMLSDYLKAQYLGSSQIPGLGAAGTCEALDVDDTVVIVGGDGASNQTAVNQIAPINGAVAELCWLGREDHGAISYSGPDYQLLFLSFGFEAIRSSDSRFTPRDTVFARMLEYFGYNMPNAYPLAYNLALNAEDSGNVVNHTPTITWAYADPEGAAQSAYQVQASDDPYWNAINLWDSGPLNGTNNSIVYNGLPLEDGQNCEVRVRVFDGALWSSWKYLNLHMNSIPDLVTIMTPNDMGGAGDLYPDLTVANPNDPEDDDLAYNFEVYSDPGMTDLVAQVSGYPETYNTTTWKVTTELSEDMPYYWRVQAFDGYEYNDWSDLASFWVNSNNQYPATFNQMEPANSSYIEDMIPTLVWEEALDPDPYDQVTYTLRIADNELFMGQTKILGIVGTQYTFTDSAEFGASYWWQVTAVDQFNAQTPSAAVFSFSTAKLGDANGDLSINIGDAVYIINYVFKGGAAPNPLIAGDANCDGLVNVGDAVFLINFVFKEGPEPGC